MKMEFKLIYSLLVLAVFGAVKVHALECYECVGDACDDIQDSMLGYCGPASTTAAPETPTTPEATTTDPTMETTDETTTGETTEETTSDTTEEATDETSTTPSEPDPTTVAPSADEAPTTGEVAKRRRRSAETVKRLPTSAAEVLLANYRLVAREARAEASYACYSADIPDGSGTKRRHGCVEVAPEQSACDAVREQNGASADLDNCVTCDTDKCNGSTALGVSLIALLAAFVVHRFCR